MPAISRLVIVCRTCGATTHAGEEFMKPCCARDFLARLDAGEFDDPHELDRFHDDGAPSVSEQD